MSSIDSKAMLVVGATGVIGRRTIEHLDAEGGWRAIGLSRRRPDFSTAAEHVSVDLMDKEDCIDKLGGLNEVTHILYAAYTDRPTWAEQCAPNAQMLENVMDGVGAAGGALERVVLMQGTKYYGSHLGPFKTPALESDPRHLPPNFYFDQQDLLMERQPGQGWTWTCLRPHTVCGFAVGMPMNLVAVIAVYAAISKELGLPLRFPGTAGGYSSIFQVTDADLLARAILWAADAPRAANESFNITNGDFFRWETVWPEFADFFGMDYAPPQAIRLADFMADKEAVWQSIVSKHDLMPTPFAQAAHWPFGDYIFHQDWDIMSDTLKARQAGFADCEPSPAMFLRLFAELRDRRFIP
ncbi:MAG: SDR family oxidoreductase [Pseudomonadota bacterium]